MQTLKIITRVALSLLLYPVNFCTPNKKDRVIFGNVYGFKDNPKYLFEYMTNNYREIDCIWIAKNREHLLEIPSKHNAYYAYSLNGIYYQLTSNIAIVTTGFGDLSRYILSKKTIIQLWHGTPIKKILLDSELNTKFISEIKWIKSFCTIIYKAYLSNYDYIISASTPCTELYKQAFNAPKEKIINCGLPRADIILESEKPIVKKPGILYAPTWRINTEESIIIIKRFIEDIFPSITNTMNYDLTISLHKKIRPHFRDEEYKGIKFIEDDINLRLKEFDYLITDYSSICFDYALTGNPTLFYTPDIGQYKKNRGLYPYYNEISKNNQYQNSTDLLKAIRNHIKNPEKLMLQNEFNNGESRERIAQHVLKITAA